MIINKYNLIEVAELRIWAYMNPLYWITILIIYLLILVFLLIKRTCNEIQTIYYFTTVRFAGRDRIEKFVESYYDCPVNHQYILLNKQTKNGRRLRNYTVMNLRRLKELNRLENKNK